jgi:hypothetical protein
MPENRQKDPLHIKEEVRAGRCRCNRPARGALMRAFRLSNISLPQHLPEILDLRFKRRL